MNLKSAALLALIGTGLLTIMAVLGLINELSASAQGLVPANQVLTSLVSAFAALTSAIFFFSFYKSQS